MESIKDSLFDEETYNKILVKIKNKKLFNTRLIYCSDINNNKLEFKHIKILKRKFYKKKVIMIFVYINRGYGVGEYNFNYCLIDVDFDYLIENTRLY